MKYIITDPEHCDGGAEVEAESPEDAAKLYFDEHCVDVSVDEEVNFTVSCGDKQWEATLEVYREVDVYCSPIVKTRGAKPKTPKKRRKKS